MAGILWYVNAAGKANCRGRLGSIRRAIWIANRTIAASTLVWMEGMAEWAPADQIAALRGLFPTEYAPPPEHVGSPIALPPWLSQRLLTARP